MFMLMCVVSRQVKENLSHDAPDLGSVKIMSDQADAGRPIDLSSKSSAEPDTSERHKKRHII